MSSLEELLQQAETERNEINKDTNRGIGKLTDILLQLAMVYGDNNKDIVKLEASYDYNIKIKKEEKEKELIQLEKKRITDTELNRYAEGLLKDDKEEIKNKKATKERLEPILKWYENYINAIKFDRREIIPKFNGFN